MNKRIEETITSLDNIMSGILLRPGMWGYPKEQEALYLLALRTKIQLLTGEPITLNPSSIPEWFIFCKSHKLYPNLALNQVVKNNENPTKEEQIKIIDLIKEWSEIIFALYIK